MYFHVAFGGCRCSVSIYEDEQGKYAYVGSLLTQREYRRQGAAKRLLRSIRKWADKKKIRVRLDAHPFDNRILGLEELEIMYMKMGFRTIERGHKYSRPMIYIP